MNKVRAKKSLGQHFLRDENIARKTAEAVTSRYTLPVLEIGPGMGALTKYFHDVPDFRVVEIDTESVDYLNQHFPQLKGRIISEDFLRAPINQWFEGKFTIAGNFPYNISSQIFFKALEYRNQVHEVVGMVQREVGRRLASGPGNKEYGILSVLLQAFYTVEYLFTVNEGVFDPPPKVKSAVIRLIRNDVTDLGCNEKLFFTVVKTAFNQRRKTMRNSLRGMTSASNTDNSNPIFDLRPEQLTVSQFVMLTNLIDNKLK